MFLFERPFEWRSDEQTNTCKTSSHRFLDRTNFCVCNPESVGKSSLVDSEILGFEIRNIAHDKEYEIQVQLRRGILPPLYHIVYVIDLNGTFVFFSTLKVSLFFLPPSGLAVLSCNVSEEAINAVKQVLESIRPKLNLHSQLPVISLTTANQIKQYLERHSLQFCVLVVDGETIKDAYENLPPRKVEYENLFKTAVERVGKISAHFVIKKK